MGWRPKDFWAATLPEVLNAIIGNNARELEQLKNAWEPARFVAYVTWQSMAGKGGKLRNMQQLIKFPWEKRMVDKSDAKKAMQQILKFRKKVKEKWGLKYPDWYE